MGKKIQIERKDGKTIHADLTQPPTGESKAEAPLVIVVNGFPKHKAEGLPFTTLLIEVMKNLGLSSLEFEFTGSQTTNPDEDQFTLASAAADMESVFSWVEENEYKRVAFIAEGLGAPITFLNLPENATFSILCWPAFNFQTAWHDQFQGFANQEEMDKKGYSDLDGIIIGAEFMNELQNTDLIPFYHKAHTPTLILHGIEDKVVPISHLDIARDDLIVPHLVITSFDGGENGLPDDTHRKTSIHHVTEFVEKYWNHDQSEES